MKFHCSFLWPLVWTVCIIICCNRQGSSNTKRIFGNSEWEGVKKATICIKRKYEAQRGRGGQTTKPWVHTCQLSQIQHWSPAPCTGHKMSRIKSTFELFYAFVWNLANFYCQNTKLLLFIAQFLGNGGWVDLWRGGGSVTIWGGG